MSYMSIACPIFFLQKTSTAAIINESHVEKARQTRKQNVPKSFLLKKICNKNNFVV